MLLPTLPIGLSSEHGSGRLISQKRRKLREKATVFDVRDRRSRSARTAVRSGEYGQSVTPDREPPDQERRVPEPAEAAHNIELRQLRYAVAVASAGSFASASKRLDRNASGLSQQIAALERAVGVQIFARTTRSVVVTPGGRAFLVHAQAALASVEQAVSAARQAGDDEG